MEPVPRKTLSLLFCCAFLAAAGKVHVVVDRGGDHRAEQVQLVADGLDMPSSLEFRQGSLLVADDQADAIYRISYREPPLP